MKNLTESLSYLENVLIQNPEDAETRFELALSYWKMEKYDLARAVMHEAPNEDWVEEVALWEKPNALYELYEMRGEEVFGYQSAFDEVHAKIERGSQLAEDFYERGHIRLLLHDLERALQDLEKATQIHPQSCIYWYEKGKIRHQMGHFAVALALLNRAIDMVPEVSFFYERGNIYFSMMHYQSAIADFDHAIDMFPSSVLAYSMRARAKFEVEDFKGALADIAWLKERYGDDSNLDWFIQEIEQRMNH